jgi:hypothetical protein
MRPPLRTGLLAAAALVVGVLATAAPPTGPAAASGQVCEGVVVDDGTGAAPVAQAAQVAPGSSDLDALDAVGDTVTQNSSGLVCAIGNYPANGLQDCENVSGGLYFYWSYWQGDPATNTWTYAEVGPAEHTVGAGQTYVEGWRYQDPGPDGPSAPKPSLTPAAAFAQACPGVTPVSSSGAGGAPSSGGGGAAGPATTATTTPIPATPSGASTAPASGAGTTAPASGGSHPATAARTPAGGVTPTAPPGTARVPASTTSTTSATGATRSRSKPTGLALATTAKHQGAGGDPALPVVVVAVLIALLGAAAWFRWRRRPGEE